MATKTKTPLTLGDEIAALLNRDTRTAAEIEALLSRVAPETERLSRRAAEVRDAALHPRLTAAEVQDMRAAADEADFEAQRITRAAEVLQAELAELLGKETEAARLARYEAAEARAEAVAARIRAEYPDLARQLLDLLGEVASATEEVIAVNHDLPQGRDMLHGPEDRARGFNLTAGTRPDKAPWLLADVVLPPLAPSVTALWPRQSDHGLVRGAKPDTMNPFSRANWPRSTDAADALAELDAQVNGAWPTPAPMAAE